MDQHTQAQNTIEGNKPCIELSCFGVPTVKAADHDLKFSTQKSLALFVFLCLHRKVFHSRDKLAEMFWPERQGAKARHSLRSAICEMRSVLYDQASIGSCLYVDNLVIGIDPAFRRLIQVDCERFDELVSRGLTNPAATAIPQLHQAFSLYVGNFMEGHDIEWIDVLRTHYCVNYDEVVTALSDYYIVQGDLRLAVQWLLRRWEADPYSEEVLQELMQIYAQWGQLNRALALCKEFADRLRRRLGVDLEIETLQLYHEIAAQKSCASCGASLAL